MLHGGSHEEVGPEEFLEHIQSDGKNATTYIEKVLQVNGTTLDAGQVTSLLWYLQGRL